MNTNAENRSQPEGTPLPSHVQAWLNTLPEDERSALRTTWDLAETARGDEPDEPDEASVQDALSAFWDTVDDRGAAPKPRLDRPARPRAATRRLPSIVRSAVVALLIACGFALGWASGAGVFMSGGTDGQTQYMVLLRGGDFADRSPEEMQRIVGEFQGWAEELQQAGRFLAGDELAEDGRVLARERGQTITQTFAMGAAGIGGYFIISARDYDEAVAIASESPQLDYGGTVEIRPIVN
ncbi:MAG: YciI family protein [Bacteroidota bacterium]